MRCLLSLPPSVQVASALALLQQSQEGTQQLAFGGQIGQPRPDGLGIGKSVE
jgi:hypothetical protein